MSVAPQYIPFQPGTRVYIKSLDVVGTVDRYELGEYLVRWIDAKNKVHRDRFADNELMEQLELPFGGDIFKI